MSCQFKDECPSYSGWCEGPRGDFSRCIPFIINAVKGARQENAALRQQLDKVKKQAGLWKKRFKMEERANEISIEELLNVTAERDAAQAALKAMRFAYVNGDTDCPHQFEMDAMRQANEILGEWPQKEDDRNGD